MAEAFEGIGKIQYEGPGSNNPLAFKHYNAQEVVAGKTMAEHLRFSVAYWHAFRNAGSDPFGAPTRRMPWDDGSASLDNAIRRVRAAFEFFSKLGVGFYCFHDTDVAPEGASLSESCRNLDAVAKVLKQEQQRTGVRLLWGTANLFSHPRYVHGAATSPNADVFAYAAAQVAKAMEVTHELGGAAYLFWGGREGYRSLLNTDMSRELEHLARFFHMAVEHKKQLGFAGPFYIEPKPKEPTKHQYDFDAAAAHAFLQTHGLTEHFRLNIEANHATLAGHSFAHELTYAAAVGLFGSVDANRGDPLLGWDTDQFPTDLYDATLAMLAILAAGGFVTGGLNFDAHVARESFEPVDLFHAHIGGMDCFARALKIAVAIRDDGVLAGFLRQRYASWDAGIGADIEAGRLGLAQLSRYMMDKGNPDPNRSGRIEMLENAINEYL